MQASSPNPLIVQPGVPDNPMSVWRAFKAEREELGNQLERLEDKRRSLVGQLDEAGSATVKSGLETRIGDLDKRIADMEKQISTADANVAKSAAVPGAVPVTPPPPFRSDPPAAPFVLSGLFIVVCLLPLSVALARRLWRRGTAAVVAFPQELADRLNRLDQSVDSIAVEVERIGEGQRFVTRLLSDNGRALGAGAAQPVEVGAREKAPINREGR
jgi:hypothetical protein